MLKIQRSADGEVVFTVMGQLNAHNIGELSALLAQEKAGTALVLDLADLMGVDRQTVSFLREWRARGIALRHCPDYLRTWIESGADVP